MVHVAHPTAPPLNPSSQEELCAQPTISECLVGDSSSHRTRQHLTPPAWVGTKPLQNKNTHGVTWVLASEMAWVWRIQRWIPAGGMGKGNGRGDGIEGTGSRDPKEKDGATL
jgi:hypothetical protein